MKPKPSNITSNRTTKTMIISWEDGHKSELSFSLLRNACPCVECQGGHDKMGNAPDPKIFYILPEDSPKTRIIKVEAVGTYAITIEWQDGHHYGVYNWNYLRALCPCPDCRAQRK